MIRNACLVAALAAVLVAAAAGAARALPLTVQTEYGPVRGLTEVVGDQTCTAWRGVRYAAPPVGDLRWSAPAPPATWSAAYNATAYGPGCPQTCDLPPHTCPTATAEDCLFLNVFAPEGATASSRLPVLFWIHGGHYEQGSGEGPFYDGIAPANRTNTVVVTINYRLGALGFLRLDAAGIGGNYGFLDQIYALQWVQRNIAAFGGDPSQVTIYGQSAGGTSVSTVLTSPMGKGLFRNIIIESNPIGLPIMGADEGNSLGGRVASDVGCSASDLACLRGQGTAALLAAQKKAGRHLNIKDLLQIFYPWAPTIDGKAILGEPLSLMMSGKVNTPDALVAGTVQEEGRIFIYMAMAKELSHLEYDAVVGATFLHKLDFFKVLKYYPGQHGDNRDQLARLATDYLFKCPIRAALRKLSSVTNTYQYRFNHSFSFDGWGPNYPYCRGHVCHGSELPFVFDLDETDVVNFSPAEKVLGNNMVAAWSAVAHRGAPAASPSWPPYTPATNATYLWEAGGVQRVDTNLDAEICDMWESIGWRY